MKRSLLAVILASSFYLLASPVHAEVIRSFDVHASLDANRRLTITETIGYDFEDAERHGIYRDIPVVYDRDGASFKLRLDVQDATMDGQPVGQSISTSGRNLELKLGDADKTITGLHTYTITYSTDRAINDFPKEGERELYWNVTGDAWPTNIEKSSFTLDGPGAAGKTICFTGSYGNTEQSCTITASGNSVSAKATRELIPGEGFTVAVRFPAASMREISTNERLWDMFMDNLWFGSPLVIFIVMFLIWRKNGKDPVGRGTVVAQYQPPRDLPPGLLSALIDQEFSQRSVTATILDLARRGYLKLKFTGEPKSGFFSSAPEFTMIKLKETDDSVFAFEKTLFDGLFNGKEEVSLKDKKNGSFWRAIQTAREEGFAELQGQGLFGKNPGSVRGTWIVVAFVVGVAGVMLTSTGLGVVSSGVCALIVAGFGWFMPTKSKEGAIVMEEAEGFKMFLSVTEKDRLDFTDAPERTPENFARFLPAAVAFGVEQKWSKQFESIDMTPPSYMDGSMDGWNALRYANLADSFHEASAKSMYAAPSSAGSGGSGFSSGGSGGGFGGGGGGSW
ncbi:MAG: DUF2207 domain-containing protein [Candidatus Uhrbacteria bacterium]